MVILIISFLAGIVHSFFVSKVSSRDIERLSGESEHEELVPTMASIILYLIISSFLFLLFLLLDNEDFFSRFFEEWQHREVFFSSGLFSSVILLTIGLVIKLIYSICLKIVSSINKNCIENLRPKEQKWILLVSLLLLIGVGIKSQNFYVAFSALALIVGKFFWLDDNIEQFGKELKEFVDLSIFSVFTLSFVCFIIFIWILTEKNMILSVFCFLLGWVIALLFWAFNKK